MMIITLTTDFGWQDPYAGIMKGVILGINPRVSLVDITHGVPPQDVCYAGLVLADAAPYFPAGTIHLVVVDPGVGSERRLIVARTGQALYLAPDNGLLTQVFLREPPQVVVTLRATQYWLPEVSYTFHGRDILAPVAAHLSLGVPVEALGSTITDWVRLEAIEPEERPDGSVVGRVVRVDHFGNLITNLLPAHLPGPTTNLLLEIAGKTVHGLCQSYVAGAGLVAVVGSNGHIEVALAGGDASTFLGVKTGCRVVFRPG